MKAAYLMFCMLFLVVLAGCTPKPPVLPPMKAKAEVTTRNTRALAELNTILQVYLPPNYEDTYYYVKPITDATGISQTGEIPVDITTLVREAISQVYYKVHYVEQYDTSDAIHVQVETLLRQTGKLAVPNATSLRPTADFTIAGNISQFDRALESTSDSKSISGSFGGGQGYSNVSASNSATSRLSRLGVSFNVYHRNGVSVPGKFGASMEVHYAKDGSDIGFAIGGFGIGYGVEATAMHGRHLALQMMAEFSAAQIIGRTMGIPYWRVGSAEKIFSVDPIVIEEWRNQYHAQMREGLLVPFMQSQCIANGDVSALVTGVLDEQTLAAFERHAEKHGLGNRQYPSWELYLSLESNRLLDTNVSAKAWNAYLAFKQGRTPLPATAVPPVKPVEKVPSRPAVSRENVPAPSEGRSQRNYDADLENLF